MSHSACNIKSHFSPARQSSILRVDEHAPDIEFEDPLSRLRQLEDRLNYPTYQAQTPGLMSLADPNERRAARDAQPPSNNNDMMTEGR